MWHGLGTLRLGDDLVWQLEHPNDTEMTIQTDDRGRSDHPISQQQPGP
jgi:hypothetical protein